MADTRRFVDPVDQSFFCDICYEVLRNPVSGCKEGHCFCLACVKTLDKCPMCSASYSNGFVKSRPADDYIQKLTVLCDHGPEFSTTEPSTSQQDTDSCPWRGPLSALKHHLNTECLFHPLPCAFSVSGCSVKLVKRLLAEHEEECDYRPQPCVHCNQSFPCCELEKHMEECEEAIVGCPLCKARLTRKNMQSHMLNACPEAEIACEFAEQGCKEKMKRKDAGKHASEYAARHTSALAAALRCATQELKEMAGLREEMKRMREEKKAMQARIEQLESEAKGVHFTWKLTADEARRELPSPPVREESIMYGTSRSDGDGVRWQLCLAVRKDTPEQVGLYVFPDRLPARKKSIFVSLKNPCTTGKIEATWDQIPQGWGWDEVVGYAELVSKGIEFEVTVCDYVRGQ